MKYSALALLGLLAVSVVSSMSQAHALDPISFETLAPFSPTDELQIDSTAFSGDYRFEEAATGDLLAYISSILNDGLITDVRNTESSTNVLGPGAVIYPNLFPWTNWGFYIDGSGSSTVDDASGTSIQYSQTLVNANYTTTSTITTQLIQGRTFMHVVSNMTFTNNIQETQSINVEVDSASHHFNFASVYQDVLTGVPTVTTVNLQQHDGTHYYYDLDVGDSLVLYNTNSGSASVAMRYLGHSINGTDFTTMTEGGVIWNTNLIVDEVDNIELHPLEQSTGSGGTPGTVYSGTTIGLVYDIIVSTTEEKDLSSWVQFVDDGVSLESVDTQFQNVYETSGGDVYFTDSLDSDDRHHISSFDVGYSQLKNYTTAMTAGGDQANSNGNAGPVETRRYSIDLDSASSETIQVVDNTAGSPLDMYNNFTLMTYIKADATSGNIIRKESNYIMEFAGGGARCSFWSGGVLQSFAFTSAALNTGQWYHLACTYDGTTLRFYLDGVPQQNAAISATIDNTNDDLYIGSNGGGANFYDGKQKDVRIYNVYKTQAQVQAVVAGTDDTGGLAAMYDFDEGAISGNTETDDAGTNGLDGVLINTPSYSTDVPTNSYTRTGYYFAGRDSATGHNVYGLVDPTRGLQIADGFGVASSYSPRAVAQSLTKVYSPLYSATTYGDLYLGQAARAFTGYSESSIYTGSAGNPAHGVLMDTSAGGTPVVGANMRTGSTTFVAEHVTATSELIGKKLDRITLYLQKTGAPTGTATIGVFNSAGATTFTCNTQNVASLTTSEVAYTYLCNSGAYVIQANDYIGITYTGGSVGNTVDVYRVTDTFDGVNSVWSTSPTPASWTDNTTLDLKGVFVDTSNVKIAVIDGSPDTAYVFFESGASSLAVVKYTSSATTISTSLSHTAGEDFSIMQMSGKILIQTSEATYTLNISTDAITTDSNTYLTRPPQTFSISPSARTYISAAYVANTETATLYNPSAGTSASDYVMIDTASAPTLTAYDPTKYYYLQTNDLTVEAASATSTSWTIKDPGTQENITVTPYTERLGINLIQNNTIFDEDVVKLLCDNGEYGVNFGKFSVGADSDCTYWKTLDIDTSSIGRMLPYERIKDVVHASDYTNYNIHLNAANPQLYSVTLEYNDKDVDYNIFDSGDNAQLRLLYGQCYQLSYKEILSGDEVQSSRVCADDVIFKESILSSTLGLIFWSSPWGATHTYNNTSLILDTIVRHLPVNYDYNVRITDKNDLVIVNANVTSPQEVSSQSYNLTAYDANKPFHLSIYNSEDKRIYQAYLDDRPQYLKPVADLFAEHSFAGWNLLMFAPLIFAAMFTRNTAGIGAGLTAAFIAFVNWIGIIDISTTIVGLIIVIGALGVIAYRKQFD